jgi:hypothetical protein
LLSDLPKRLGVNGLETDDIADSDVGVDLEVAMELRLGVFERLAASTGRLDFRS